MLSILQTTIPDAFWSILNGLPTAAVLFYVWYSSNTTHARERAEWRNEIKATNEILTKVTEQVNKLTFIIENYVINQPKTTNRG